jgi:hypothetical protein
MSTIRHISCDQRVVRSSRCLDHVEGPSDGRLGVLRTVSFFSRSESLRAVSMELKLLHMSSDVLLLESSVTTPNNVSVKRMIQAGRTPPTRGYKMKRRSLMTLRSIWEPAPLAVPHLLVETSIIDAKDANLKFTPGDQQLICYINTVPFFHVYRWDVPWTWQRPER